MAFTPEQETKLLSIISAFDNGKRLTDLPEFAGTDPFSLYTEVIGSNGLSKKAKMSTLLPYLENECMYGIEYDVTSTDPDVTRIGSSDLHRSLPIQSRMRGCLLSDAGTVNQYLNDADWSAHTLDGSAGQVMVELPSFYIRFETDGNIRRVKMSEYPLAGYTFVKKKYVSAYEAAVDRSTAGTPKLASVVNLTADFRGGQNESDWDGSYKSLLGKPATSISLTNFRAYARNRKALSNEWNCNTYDIQKELFWLFCVEYATRNSQKAFNAQKTAAGYRQGGLGDGISNMTGWETFNNYNPIVNCGATNSLGNGSGEIAIEIKDGDDVTVVTTHANRYRGIENPFGHIFKWTDGILVNVSPDVENGGDGTSKVYVCEDPADFSSSAVTDYTHVGNEHRTNGYVGKVIFGGGGEIMCLENGAGSSSQFCDYSYVSIPTDAASLRGVRFGGFANSGASCGFVCSISNSAPSNTSQYIGSRLCFIPA